ncbi:unnamed protein product [Withania somnifera]
MSEATSLVDLPSPILLEILSRLPHTTLLHVKSVCKSFLKLTLDSDFSKLSPATSPASIILNQFHKSRTASRTNTLKFLNDVDSIYILNPRTREYIILPEAQGVRKWPNLVTYGFGFDPVTFEYKVVRIYQEEIRDDTNGSRYYKSEAQVYTVGKGYWRNARHVMFCFGCRAYGLNLYGKLHWLVSDANGMELICSFNLENELFESFPTAPGYTEKNCPNLRSLGVFGHCLCVCDNNADGHFEVWVMKEYGVNSSWVKETVINITSECNKWNVLENGEMLFLWRDDFLFLHHPVKKTLKMLDVCEGNFLASAHVSSSFSLKNFEAEAVNVF